MNYLTCTNCPSTSFAVVVESEAGDPPRRYECSSCGSSTVRLGPEA